MIVVIFNKPDFEYDVHSLLKEFFLQDVLQLSAGRGFGQKSCMYTS